MILIQDTLYAYYIYIYINFEKKKFGKIRI